MTKLILPATYSLCLIIGVSSFVFAEIVWTEFTDFHLGTAVVWQFTAMFVCMIAAWRFGPRSSKVADYKALLIIAVVVRVLLVGVEPYTSNDVSRYMFDGKIALIGLDPYVVTHDATVLADLKSEWRPPEEHAKYPTIYPPAAIALFSLSAAFGSGKAVYVWKVLCFFASVTTLFVMVRLLRRSGKLHHIALVALSPILVLEAGIGAHVDSFTTLTIVLVCYFYQKNKRVAVGIFIGLGMLIKLIPIVLLGPLVLSSKRILSAAKLVFAAIGVCCIGYATALFIGLKPIGSAPVFFAKWRNASPLFEWLEHTATEPQLLACLLIITCFTLAVVGVKSLKNNGIEGDLHSRVVLLQIVIALPLIISPVIFPWYLMPLVPLFALRPTWTLGSWFLLLPLSYLVLNEFALNGIWQPVGWVTQAIGIGLVAGFLIDVFSFKKTRLEN